LILKGKNKNQILGGRKNIMKALIEKVHQHPYTISVKHQVSILFNPFHMLLVHFKNLDQAVG
jgi:hypothetical protein